MRHAVFQKPHCNKKVKLLLLHERYHYRLLSVETVFGLIKYLIRVRLEHICGYLFTAVSRQAMLNHTAAVCNRKQFLIDLIFAAEYFCVLRLHPPAPLTPKRR